MRTADRFDLLAIATVAVGMTVYFSATAARVTQPGLPLDDSWIHMEFARNLGAGRGFVYNPGVPSSGSTAPLWTLLLAVPAFLHVDLLIASKVFGVALTIAAAFIARSIVATLTGSRLGAMVAGLAVVLSARMTWASVSGMEVPLYVTLVLLAIAAYLTAIRTGRAARWAWLLALACITRPEIFTLAPVFLLHWMWSRRQTGAWRAGIVPVAIVAAVVAAYVTFNYTHGGQPLPGTFYAKTKGLGLATALAHGQWRDAVRLGVSQPIEYLNTFLKWGDEQAPFLMLVALVGGLALTGVLPLSGGDRRGGGLVVALMLLVPVLRGALVPAPPLLAQNGRYIDHALVLYFMIAAAGIAYLWAASKRHWAVAVITVLALARLASQDVKFAPRYAAEVKNINDLQIVTGEWVRSHTTPDAVVATNDIGAIAYFGQRSILDLEGLVTPEAVAYKRTKTLATFLERTQPDLLIIFPEWYPELAARTDLLHEITRVSSPKVVAYGPTLVIYRMPWTHADRLTGLPGQ